MYLHYVHKLFRAKHEIAHQTNELHTRAQNFYQDPIQIGSQVKRQRCKKNYNTMNT
jgi:hypothetical protein